MRTLCELLDPLADRFAVFLAFLGGLSVPVYSGYMRGALLPSCRIVFGNETAEWGWFAFVRPTVS
jgi:hypothetical protein